MIEPTLQRYYEDRQSMMLTKGWQDLMEDVERMLLATNDISSIQDEKTLHYRRGEISMMRWMLALKDVSEQTYQQIKDDEQSLE